MSLATPQSLDYPSGDASATALNRKALAGNARREARNLALLTLPAFSLTFVFVVLPVIWLFALSFVEKGQFGLGHYERMITYSSYSKILFTTLKISGIVTVICAVLGYPVAYLIAQLPGRLAMAFIALIIIPFWTSVLVRSYAWLVLLTDAGPVNQTLMWLGLVDQPVSLLFNETGSIIGMVHIMLPFFILPVYAVIRSFDWRLLEAASSLGAPPVSAFLRVFLPLSLPGVLAGAVLVFVQCLGFFVTPAVLGGGKVTMVSMKIASNVQQYFDWGAASALGIVLLFCVLSILYIGHRLFDLDRLLGVR